VGNRHTSECEGSQPKKVGQSAMSCLSRPRDFLDTLSSGDHLVKRRLPVSVLVAALESLPSLCIVSPGRVRACL